MPTIIIGGYIFRFYLSDRFEPAHVHVLRDRKVAKVWLNPVTLAYNHGYTRGEITRILALVREHVAQFQKAWDDYFSR